MKYSSKDSPSPLFLLMKEKLIDKDADVSTRVANTQLVLDCVESLLKALKESYAKLEFTVGQQVYVVGQFAVHATQIKSVQTNQDGDTTYWLQKLSFWRKLRQFMFLTPLWYEEVPGTAGENFFASETDARQCSALKSLQVQISRHFADLVLQLTSRDKIITEKTLHNSDFSGTRQNVADLQTVGNPDLFQLLCKASSQAEGWMKSTKAMQVPSGCLVQVSTKQRNPDGSYAVAEALTFVPDVKIVDDHNYGRKLVAISFREPPYRSNDQTISE